MEKSPPERRAFDWPAAYARLDRAARALAAGEEPPPEQKRRILDQRTRDLAKPAAAAAPGDLVELLAFPVAEERYAVDVTRVVEVAPLRYLTRLPGVPAPFAGIIHHRGRVVPVLDIPRLTTGVATVLGDACRAVVVEVGDTVFGLVSDGAAEVIRVSLEVLAPPIERGGVEPFVRGLTRDAIAILDLEAFMADPRIANDRDGLTGPEGEVR